jgi:hypothetical protein
MDIIELLDLEARETLAALNGADDEFANSVIGLLGLGTRTLLAAAGVVETLADRDLAAPAEVRITRYGRQVIRECARRFG